MQKLEGLAILDDGRLAIVNDNDFTVAQIVIDNATGTFTRAATYVPEAETVGLISVPGLDASDRDTAINIRDWPVLGMYEPDALATFTNRGENLLRHRQRGRRARLAGIRGRGAHQLPHSRCGGIPDRCDAQR